MLNALLPHSHRGRVLALGALIDAIATGVYLAVATLYFVEYVKIPAPSVGVAIAIANVCGLLVPMPVARLTQHLGVIRVYIALLVVRGVGMAAYVLADGYWRYVAVTCLFTMASRAALPLLQVLIGQMEGEEDRTRTMASMRTVNNIGLAVGFLIAGLVQMSHSHAGYLALFVACGASFAVVALVTVRATNGVVSRDTAVPVRQRRASSVYRDGRFITVAVANAVLMMHDSMLFILIPLWVVQRCGLSPTASSTLLILNTVITVVIQVRLAKYAKGVRGAMRLLRWSIVALVIAGLLLGLADDDAAVWQLLALLTGAVVLLTVGENLHAVSGWELSFLMSDPEKRAQYLSLFSLGYTGQQIIGPVLMTAVVLPWGMSGVMVVTAMFVVAALVTSVAVKRHSLDHDEAKAPA